MDFVIKIDCKQYWFVTDSNETIISTSKELVSSIGKHMSFLTNRLKQSNKPYTIELVDMSDYINQPKPTPAWKVAPTPRPPSPPNEGAV